MNTREQFGKYLLLKKLSEDALGETFRAGELGAQGMERVALLRIFNGQGLDGQRLWQATEGRVGIQQVLRSPNIGEGIDVGQVQGIPFVAYDYISGKNLTTLLEQAAKKRNYVPTEHALLITERVSLALAAAGESRLEGERVLHGFLVPNLVMISNEGEARLTGFEVAPGLRGFAANPVVRQHFGRYLAPETLHGAAPHRADDIYSLGAILFELLTGKPLPPPAADGYTSIIDGATLATEGSSIPAELANLLRQSLVAREHRIGDVVAWHKTLNKWMFDGQYNPTTFNLAFYMHNLFRQEIERESKEIEVEKTLPLPTIPPASGPVATGPVATVTASGTVPTATPTATAMATAPVAVPTEGAGDHELSSSVVLPPRSDKKGEKSKLPMILLAALLLLAIGGTAYWWMSRGGDDAATQAAALPPPPPEPVVEEPPEPVPAGPTEEELRAQIEALVAQQTDGVKEELNKQYRDQLTSLERQLQTAQAEAELREKQEAERLAAEQQAIADQEAEEARLQAEREAAEKAAAEKAAAEAEAAAAEEQPPEAEVAPPPPPPPPPPEPPVRRGDLVELGPGVIPPKVIKQAPTRFPEMAKRLNRKSATVQLRVLVDENGKVLRAELAEGDQPGFGFDTEALRVAKNSTFSPASKSGVKVKCWLPLSIRFRD